MPVPDPPITHIGARSERAHDLWRAPAYRADVLALEPLSLLYRAVMSGRRAAYGHGLLRAARVQVPVISVGNLVVGGSGKTPFTRWLTGYLRSLGRTPAVLHGGYASDEPALHRRWYPDTIVIEGRDRAAGARQAISRGADVIVLDDAMQHLRIARDLDIVLIAADTWSEPHRILPAGAWREPLSAIPANALVVVTRKAASQSDALVVAAILDKRKAGIAATCALSIEVAATGPCIAVCAIADPRAFARQLVQAGVVVQEVLAFQDHHEYSALDWQHIGRVAAGRQIVVTEKDAVKLEKLTETALCVAVQRVEFDNPAQVTTVIEGVLR